MTLSTELAAQLAADKVTALALTPVSRETEARLDRYVDLLLQWQATTNLVAASTLPQLWTRHIADSLQLLELAPAAASWTDLGSGGGFPGIVLACAVAERGGRVELVERNVKKAAFLREALRLTAAPGTVHHGEIADYVDSVQRLPDCVTARALAPLGILLELAAPLLRQGTKALLLKGQDVGLELTDATKYWKIQPILHRSRTAAEGWIVEIDRLEPASLAGAASKRARR